MKRYMMMFAGVAMGFGILSAYAAQDTAIDNVEVRDPIRLEAYLEANASDAQSRLAALEVSLGTNTTTLVTVGALTTTGAVTIAEGKLADSTIVSADIKDGVIVSADLANATAFSLGAVTTTGMTTTVGFTLATKVCSLATLTNLVYNNGATTGNVNIVTWTP